jgi:hypothetical protein
MSGELIPVVIVVSLLIGLGAVAAFLRKKGR